MKIDLSYQMNSTNKQPLNNLEPIKDGIFSDIQRLADRSLDAIYHYADDERKYLFINRRFVELFGLDSTNHRTIPVDQVLNRIHPEDRDNLSNAIESFLTSGNDKGEMHYRLLQPDGNIVVTGTGIKRHVELVDTIKVGLARIRIKAHIPHVPYKRRLEGVDLGNGATEFGSSECAPLDVNISNKGNIKIAIFMWIEFSDNRCVAGCG